MIQRIFFVIFIRDGAITSMKKHREKFNLAIKELSESLPIPDEMRSNLDKVSVIKIAVSFLKLQSLIRGKHVLCNVLGAR